MTEGSVVSKTCIFNINIPDSLTETVVIVGGSEVSYGRRLDKGTYKELYLREVQAQLDWKRVHFVGKVAYPTFLKILQVSSAHVYLTYPFVLSWSMMEAMAAGCLVIGSRTPPVAEVISDGQNGLLVDFFDHEALADKVSGALEHPSKMRRIREQARRSIIDKYDLRSICLPRQQMLIERR